MLHNSFLRKQIPKKEQILPFYGHPNQYDSISRAIHLHRYITCNIQSNIQEKSLSTRRTESPSRVTYANKYMKS